MLQRLNYANVVATLALFIALGGGAYAATKIHGKDIAPRTIGAKHIKKGTLSGTEIGKGAITRSKLSPAVQNLLPDPNSDFGGGQPGFDGLPGEPGTQGEPGEPGPPGTGCDPGLGLLCGDADLPAGTVVSVPLGGADSFDGDRLSRELRHRVRVHRRALRHDPGAGADRWFQQARANQGAATHDIVLAVGPDGGPPQRRLALDNAVPTGLRSQGDRYELLLAAASVTESGP